MQYKQPGFASSAVANGPAGGGYQQPGFASGRIPGQPAPGPTPVGQNFNPQMMPQVANGPAQPGAPQMPQAPAQFQQMTMPGMMGNSLQMLAQQLGRGFGGDPAQMMQQLQGLYRPPQFNTTGQQGIPPTVAQGPRPPAPPNSRQQMLNKLVDRRQARIDRMGELRKMMGGDISPNRRDALREALDKNRDARLSLTKRIKSLR